MAALKQREIGNLDIGTTVYQICLHTDTRHGTVSARVKTLTVTEDAYGRGPTIRAAGQTLGSLFLDEVEAKAEMQRRLVALMGALAALVE